MAEFQEVIKQMKRMCAHFTPTCNGCKLCMGKGTNEFCGEEPKDMRSDPALIEAVVMQWAEEHPEPVYPTWIDVMKMYGVTDETGYCYLDSAYKPIPADIAQKLGIEPKEANCGT